MYPQRELIRLGTYKSALRRRVGTRRIQLVEAAARAGEPFAWIDRMMGHWRRLAPLVRLAAVPLGIMAARTAFSRLKYLGPLLRWGPLVFGAMRRAWSPR